MAAFDVRYLELFFTPCKFNRRLGRKEEREEVNGGEGGGSKMERGRRDRLGERLQRVTFVLTSSQFVRHPRHIAHVLSPLSEGCVSLRIPTRTHYRTQEPKPLMLLRVRRMGA